MSIRRDLYDVEDTEAARQLKRFMAEQLFEQRIKTNEAAARMNVTSGRMYTWLNEGNMITNPPMHLIPLWTRVIGPQLLNYLAHQAGYTVVELPKGPADLFDTPKTASRAMKESAGAISHFIQCAEDGKVTEEEWRGFVREAQEALSAIAGMISKADEMRAVGRR